MRKDFQMTEQAKANDKRSMHFSILGVVGIILVIIGAAIVFIPGAPMRGSGLGTASIVVGVVLVIIDLIRPSNKPQK